MKKKGQQKKRKFSLFLSTFSLKKKKSDFIAKVKKDFPNTKYEKKAESSKEKEHPSGAETDSALLSFVLQRMFGKGQGIKNRTKDG